jgi:hypothetical protein
MNFVTKQTFVADDGSLFATIQDAQRYCRMFDLRKKLDADMKEWVRSLKTTLDMNDAERSELTKYFVSWTYDNKDVVSSYLDALEDLPEDKAVSWLKPDAKQA